MLVFAGIIKIKERNKSECKKNNEKRDEEVDE
jgi:hypothetical protein